MDEPRILTPPPPKHALYWTLGLAALAANAARHALRSYRRPRPFSPRDAAATAEYDHRVWTSWTAHLAAYLGKPCDLTGKTVLELGPGPDLGTGALALAAGVARYIAFDRFALARSTPREAHEQVVSAVLARAGAAPAKAEEVMRAIRGAIDPASPADAGASAGYAVASPARYVCRADFDLAAAGLPPADLVVSQAAFEHFDSPAATIAQLARVAAPGAVFLAVVDLQTHTGILRDRDPLNIYRYSPGLYRRLRFAGCPNRARPREYVRWLIDAGWTDVQVRPMAALPADYVRAVAPHLAAPFRDEAAEMHLLAVALCATRA